MQESLRNTGRRAEVAEVEEPEWRSSVRSGANLAATVTEQREEE
jgi:hypothetical protein